MKNFFSNIIKRDYFFVIMKKILKRFEKNTSHEAQIWAKQNTNFTTEEFCTLVDSELFDEILPEVKLLENEAKAKLKKLKVTLGGGGNYTLLYFLVRKLVPNIVVETGVAAGWSSLAILRGFNKNKNKNGKLYSSDFPYFRLENPEQYIGILAKNEINRTNWFLDIRGDDVAINDFKKKIGNHFIDIIHYDSDKSYSGRDKFLKNIYPNINSKTVIIFDDIQDNLHFRNLVNKNKENFCIIEFNNKYLGLLGINFLNRK